MRPYKIPPLNVSKSRKTKALYAAGEHARFPHNKPKPLGTYQENTTYNVAASELFHSLSTIIDAASPLHKEKNEQNEEFCRANADLLLLIIGYPFGTSRLLTVVFSATN